ncbi:MAG TPA: OmpA family protein [Caulobacteraceae bacterium]|jgi:outer membrane protein OmpA-like peptidoglycan-associated protein
MQRLLFAIAFIAAAGPPVGASAHEFIFYFRYDSTDAANPEWARHMARDTACYARQASANRVHVVAHTDTAGSPEYNLALSRRRAEVVADLLVREGVPRERISLEGRGEAAPAIASGDGVREPLNRRATIDVGFAPGPVARCEGPTLPKLPQPSSR